jgi:DNA mismatch repair protein MutS
MEPFVIDSQTFSDLEIFESETKENSIFSIFDHCSTPGGRKKLIEIFNHPLTDAKELQDRQNLIAGLENLTFNLAVDRQSLELITYFISQTERVKPYHPYAVWKDFLLFRGTQSFYIKQRGVHELLDLFIHITEACADLDLDSSPALIKEIASSVAQILHFPVISISKDRRPAPINIAALARCNHIFRQSAKKEVEHILDLIYRLDAYLSVANTAKSYKLSYPQLYPAKTSLLNINGAFHLQIKYPAGNNIHFNVNRNVFFLTGSNMAGKSTLLKSAAICIYLAHLGFPVPAKSMNFSIFKGLITTINLPDNLSLGYSHFYNEVKRVKDVALSVNKDLPMVVIFDELFRGTNVKDAYDGSVAIIKGFAQLKSTFLMISTHIVEVAHELKDHPAMDFHYMETDLSSGTPVFSYQLKEGITEERMGMWIINNEGIVDILNSKATE